MKKNRARLKSSSMKGKIKHNKLGKTDLEGNISENRSEYFFFSDTVGSTCGELLLS
jgi:hypothetical protein